MRPIAVQKSYFSPDFTPFLIQNSVYPGSCGIELSTCWSLSPGPNQLRYVGRMFGSWADKWPAEDVCRHNWKEDLRD